jgi:hypothetical protein
MTTRIVIVGANPRAATARRLRRLATVDFHASLYESPPPTDMTKWILAIALISSPTFAFAGHKSGPSQTQKHAATAQKHADAAHKSAAAHAAKGNSSAAKNMAKIAEQRQKAADRAARKK